MKPLAHTFFRSAALRDLALASLLVLAAALPASLRAAEHGVAAPRPAALSTTELRALLAAMPRGDAARGQQLHQQQFCASCHGNEGVAPTPNWPHVAGQPVAYTYKLLVDYQRGIRAEGERASLMHSVAQAMTPQQMADIAAWYATLSLPREAETPRPEPATAVNAEQLARRGDPARLLTACASCHGVRGQGSAKAVPALAGQNPQYFLRTLQHYHGGQRSNDAQRGMRAFAGKLSADEAAALARYYADLPLAP